MSFEDLPKDWNARPVHEPAIVADVLDLVVSEADRRAGALAILLCDGEGRLLQPCVVGPLPASPPEDERAHMIGVFVHGLGPGGSMLLAIARSDGLSITADDQVWMRAAQRACGTDVRLLGLHVVTLGGSREVVPSGADH